ncbi:MAG: metallophosphoesterase [Verrucomicrobiales bacterium]
MTCKPGGGGPMRFEVPFLHGTSDLVPPELEGLLLVGDLQCFDPSASREQDRSLLGFLAAAEIAALCDCGLLPPADRIGVLLTGDLFAIPTLMKRGGTGDVDGIWLEFAKHFRWVAGVAGNHDLFEGRGAFCGALMQHQNIHPLDGTSVELDGLRVGGVSGVLGTRRTGKPWRHSADELSEKLLAALSSSPDLLLLHEGPISASQHSGGNSQINEHLGIVSRPPLVAFGHRHWPEPWNEAGKFRFLNLEARIVLLTRESAAVAL